MNHTKKVTALLLSLLLLLAACVSQQPPPEEEATPLSPQIQSAPAADDSVSQFPLPDLTPGDFSAPWEDLYDEEPLHQQDDSEASFYSDADPEPLIVSNPSASSPVPTEPAPETPTAAAESSQPDVQPVERATPVGPGVETEELEAAAPALGLSGETIEVELFRLINREREAAGLPALGMEDAMRWAARMRAPETLDSLSHTRPDGTPYYTAFDEAGFTYAGKWHGENVSTMIFPVGTYSEKDAALKMFEALKGSAGHYQNMLSENFHQAGIGVVIHEVNGTVYLGSAQMFSSF